ncbi:MAG: hypothetical protein ABJG68_13740 [Crocinitomicaceae bacterium]
MKNFTLLKSLSILLLFIGISFSSVAQSPQKYFDNGMYEKAYVQAVYKQNKKVKLKDKFTSVIYKSWDIIYADHLKTITDPESSWIASYNKVIRLTKFRAQVKHEGVRPQVKNALEDEEILDHLALKFNTANQIDIDNARQHEANQDYNNALALYKDIASRHRQAEPITTLTKKLQTRDYQKLIDNANQKMGDIYIADARSVLGTTEHSAIAAIDLVNLARSYRPLSPDEEGIIELANLIKGQAWLEEAKNLFATGTKQNARLAFELIEKARSKKALSAEEEQLSKDAKNLGMTRVSIFMQGDSLHSSSMFSGLLNGSKHSFWVTFYDAKSHPENMDFKMEITENKPTIFTGKLEKEIKQESKTVEYWVEETDANGNTKQVKKTREAIGVVAILRKRKIARLQWSAVLKDLRDGSSTYSESNESKVELINEYASLVSGDVLVMPEDTESKVDLESQGFPSDDEMKQQVTDTYISEFKTLIYTWQIQSLF